MLVDGTVAFTFQGWDLRGSSLRGDEEDARVDDQLLEMLMSILYYEGVVAVVILPSTTLCLNADANERSGVLVAICLTLTTTRSWTKLSSFWRCRCSLTLATDVQRCRWCVRSTPTAMAHDAATEDLATTRGNGLV